MKILLIGEYSRLHNSLKEGLEYLGHEAVIVSAGDAFKAYDTDYNISATFTGRRSLKKIRAGFIKLLHVDIAAMERAWRFKKILPQLKDFDVIQFINSDALEMEPKAAQKLYAKLFGQNGPVCLLVCGDETPVVDYALSGNLKYSVLTPYLKNKKLKPLFAFTLKYVTKPYRKLFNFVLEHSQQVITSDLDYELPMQALGYKTAFIPNPVNTNKIEYTEPVVKDKIVIFLGINRLSYNKKGIVFFEEALKIIKKKFPEKTEILISENLPYNKYILKYNLAHILLDQVYAYDQGYNALEAMAKGKVVFTGAESEFTDYYNLTERVAVNAVPDAEVIAKELEYFITNPNEIIATGKRAKKFIEAEHHYTKIAKQYLDTYNNMLA